MKTMMHHKLNILHPALTGIKIAIGLALDAVYGIGKLFEI